jgi:two-component system OmpR family sensor kinase
VRVLAADWMGDVSQCLGVGVRTLPRAAHHPGQAEPAGALLRVRPRELLQLAEAARAPLAAILGSLDRLAGPAPAAGDGVRSWVVSGIRRGAVRQARFLDNLGALAELQLGRVPRRSEQLDVRGLLRQLPADLAEETGEARVLLAVLSGLKSGPVVAGDGAQLQHAVRELVRNAVAASQPGQTVMISVGASGPVRDPEVTIRIEDCGRGIPADELVAVLQPFVRTRWAAEQRQAGVGLGLAVADGVIRAHLGRLELTSLAGQGTRVLIRLPGAAINRRRCV